MNEFLPRHRQPMRTLLLHNRPWYGHVHTYDNVHDTRLLHPLFQDRTSSRTQKGRRGEPATHDLPQ